MAHYHPPPMTPHVSLCAQHVAKTSSVKLILLVLFNGGLLNNYRDWQLRRAHLLLQLKTHRVYGYNLNHVA